MSELRGVINVTNFQGVWITLVTLWITPQVCGPAAAKEKIAATF